jgi:hypothetical protein
LKGMARASTRSPASGSVTALPRNGTVHRNDRQADLLDVPLSGRLTMGRRAHKPDPAGRRQVEAMAGYGIPEADIATVLEIDPKTLRKHYRKELDKGHIKSTAKVAENLYRKATGDGREAVTAAIFWLKTRAGWKETAVRR